MYVREAGRPGSRAVLLVHGQVLDGSAFDGLAERLAPRFRVLVPDLPGYGRSPLLRPYSREAVREALERELAARGAGAVSVVGWSQGAYDALALALSGRVRVERLVLLGAVAGADPETRAAFAAHAEAVRGGMEAGPVFARTALPPAWAEAHPEAVAWLVALASAAPRETLVADLESVAAMPDLRPRLGEVRVPTLLRVGELDQSTPRALSEAIARAVPGATLEVAPGVGHACLLQDAEGTAASVERFLGGAR